MFGQFLISLILPANGSLLFWSHLFLVESYQKSFGHLTFPLKIYFPNSISLLNNFLLDTMQHFYQMFAIIRIIIFLISSVSLPFFRLPVRVPSIPASWFQTIIYFSFLLLEHPAYSLPLLYLFTFAAVMISSFKQNNLFFFMHCGVSWSRLQTGV